MGSIAPYASEHTSASLSFAIGIREVQNQRINVVTMSDIEI